VVALLAKNRLLDSKKCNVPLPKPPQLPPDPPPLLPPPPLDQLSTSPPPPPLPRRAKSAGIAKADRASPKSDKIAAPFIVKTDEAKYLRRYFVERVYQEF